MYADGTPGTKPYVPLATSVCANVSLFSTYSSRIVLALDREYEEAGERRQPRRRGRSRRRGIRCGMPPTTPERYAVVSCHVERLLDDRVWARFAELQERRPGGLRSPRCFGRPTRGRRGRGRAPGSSGLARPPTRGPLGHHTHWTAPDPCAADAAATRRARAGGRRAGCGSTALRPTLFCGGGWYTDRAVARGLCRARLRGLHAACVTARLSPRRRRSARARRACAARARRAELARAADHALRRRRARGASRRRACRRVVHVYFHDTDLVDGARRGVISLRCASSRAAARGATSTCSRRSARPRRSVGGHRARRGGRPTGRRIGVVPSEAARRSIGPPRARRRRRPAGARRRSAGDVRRSRLYLLSRGPGRASCAAGVELLALVVARRRWARARGVRRPRPARARLRRHRLLAAPLGRRARRTGCSSSRRSP